RVSESAEKGEERRSVYLNFIEWSWDRRQASRRPVANTLSDVSRRLSASGSWGRRLHPGRLFLPAKCPPLSPPDQRVRELMATPVAILRALAHRAQADRLQLAWDEGIMFPRLVRVALDHVV